VPRAHVGNQGEGAQRMRRPRLRKPRAMVALAALIVGAGVFSSSVGIGALPTSTLPVYGVTNGDGSRTTVAVLGDINGDHINDYAVGMPYADADGADSGIVYVFLGRAGAATPTATPVNLAAASFRITGHGGEMLGYAIAGGDLNGDGRSDIAIGAPMAGAPSRSNGGAVYIVYGQVNPANLSTTTLSPAGYTNNPANPGTQSPLGSRYDGFTVDSHTGMALSVVADLNARNNNDEHTGAGLNDLVIGMSDAALHRPGGGGAAVIYGKRTSVHINLADLWEAGYPYYFHVDYPSLDNQHVGESVAGLPDVTGDGVPDIAIGAPQADPNGRTDAGSVWIISGDLPPATGCRQPTVDATCPWIRLNQLSAVQGYRIDGATAGDGLGSSLASVGDQNADGIPDLAIGESAASPGGRSSAGAVVVVPGQHGSATRDLATSPPLQRIYGAMPGAGLGASVAAAGDVDGDGHTDILVGAPGESSFAGAAYLVRGVAGATTDLALVPAKLQPAGAGAQAGSAVAGGQALDGSGVDGLIAAPGVSGAFIVSGPGMLNPPIPPTVVPPVPPVPPVAPAPPPVQPAPPPPPGKKLKLCPVKPAKHKTPCRPRPKPRAKPSARGGQALPVR
jgi:FG-GAP repeat protein